MRRLFLLLCITTISFSGVQGQNPPDNAKVLSLYENQRFAEAAAYLEAFYQEASTDTKLMNSLAYSHRMARDLPKAGFYYNKLYQLDTANVTALASLAWINQHRGMHNAASDFYQKILLIDSSYIDAYTALASLAKNNQDFISAYNYLLIANRLQPSNSAVANDFAEICISLKKMNTADSVLTTALESDPDNAGLIYSKAKVLDGLKKHYEVVKLTERLVELGEDSRPVWSLQAKSHFNLSNNEATMFTYTKAMEKYEAWGEIDYYYMAISCRHLKRLDESLDYIEQALKEAISSNTGFYFAQKAGILVDLNKPSAAAATYIRSFQYHEEAIDYFNLAVLYDHNLKNKVSALKYYKLYLSKEPEAQEKTYIDYAKKRILAL